VNAAPAPESFLSGETGHVAGVRRTLLRTLGDRLLDARLRGVRRGIDDLADATPRRRVLALSVYRPDSAHIAPAAAELHASRHDVGLALGSTGAAIATLAPETAATELRRGKFQNLNALLQKSLGTEFDWLLVVDDDVELPERFLDRFLALTEHFEFALAQPAQTLRSHAAWRVTRRQRGSLARQTRFVEIGPVTAFRRDAAAELTPFPELTYGWGLDLSWAALAAQRGWRMGVVDAVPVRHEYTPVATAYRHQDAIEEARSFLTGRPFVTSQDAQQTVTTYRTLER
jgi:hypothetical protein